MCLYFCWDALWTFLREAFPDTSREHRLRPGLSLAPPFTTNVAIEVYLLILCLSFSIYWIRIKILTLWSIVMRKNTDKALQTLSSTKYSIYVNYYCSQLLIWMVGWFRFAYYQFYYLLAWAIGGWYLYNLNLPVFVELSYKEPYLLGRYFVPSYQNSAHIIGCGWSPCVMPAHGILRHWVEGRRADKRGWSHFTETPKYYTVHERCLAHFRASTGTNARKK